MGAVLRHSGYATASQPVDEALSIIAEGTHSGSKIPRAYLPAQAGKPAVFLYQEDVMGMETPPHHHAHHHTRHTSILVYQHISILAY